MAQTRSRLSREELIEFRQMLQTKREELAADIEQMQAEVSEQDEPKSVPQSNLPTHLADVASEQHQREKERAMLESQRELLREVDLALDRIARGTYGICEGTGEPISPQRLRAQPWTRYSIEYARQIERE